MKKYVHPKWQSTKLKLSLHSILGKLNHLNSDVLFIISFSVLCTVVLPGTHPVSASLSSLFDWTNVLKRPPDHASRLRNWIFLANKQTKKESMNLITHPSPVNPPSAAQYSRGCSVFLWWWSFAFPPIFQSNKVIKWIFLSHHNEDSQALALTKQMKQPIIGTSKL